MPVTVTTFPAGTPREQTLLDELVAELRAPHPSGQPIIQIKQMGRGSLRHVFVIWDKWHDCPPETRGQIVREAFAAVEGDEYEKSIAITIPATVPEAAEIGLLPFEVRPLGEGFRPAAGGPAGEALLREGASVLGSPAVPVLRFATEREAAESLARLKVAAPDTEWGIVVTKPTPG